MKPPARRLPPPSKLDAAVIILALLLTFCTHFWVAGGYDFPPLAASSLFMLLASMSVVLLGAPKLAPGLGLVVLSFAGALAVGLLQLAPAPDSLAHPFWSWLPDASAITLDKDATWRELIKLCGLAAAFLLGLQFGWQDARRRFFFRAFLILILAFGVWSFVSFLAGGGRASAPNGDGPSSAAGAADVAAACFGMFMIVSAAVLRRTVRDHFEAAGQEGNESAARAMAAPAAALIISVIGLMSTASVAGALSFVVAALIFAALEARTIWRSQDAGLVLRIVQVVLAVIVVATIGVLFGGMALSGAGSDDAADHALLYATHWRAFASAPWLGNGLGTFHAVNNMLMTVDNWAALGDGGGAHNFVLQWLEEAGLIGAALMFSAVAVVLFIIYRGLALRRRARIWLRAILCASLGTILFSLFDPGVDAPSIAIQWTLLMGVGVGMAAAKSASGQSGTRGGSSKTGTPRGREVVTKSVAALRSWWNPLRGRQ